MSRRRKNRSKIHAVETSSQNSSVQAKEAPQSAKIPSNTYDHNDIKVVLNGGGDVLNSATVPIQWWLSAKILNLNPKYLLIIDLEEKDLSKDTYDQNTSGRRYIAKINDSCMYLQMHTPGKHKFVIYVIHPVFGSGYVTSNNENTCDMRGKIFNKKFLAYYSTEVLIPEEFFATKSKKGLSLLIWKWTNLWFKEEPIDECAYRKRKIFAFTLKPLFASAVMGIGSIATFLTLVSAFLTFFFGYKTVSILSEMKAAFFFHKGDLWMNAYDVYNYKVWSYSDGGKKKKMPITGIELVGYGIVTWIILGLFPIPFIHVPHWVWYVVIVLITIFILILLGTYADDAIAKDKKIKIRKKKNGH